MHTLAVLLVQANESAVQTQNGAHEIIAVRAVSLLVLLQTLDFEV